MTPDLRREFGSLSDRANQQLKDVPVSKSYRNVFSFWKLPSFGPSFRCSIYESSALLNDKLPFAEFVIWRSDLDLEKFDTPVERLKYQKELNPTFEKDVLWLTHDDVAQIEQRIHGISVPVYLSSPLVEGCDGTSFEFHSGDFFSGLAMRWWESFPIEWRPFTETIVQIVDELDSRRKIGSVH